LHFQSIEEKVIFEKLAKGRPDEPKIKQESYSGNDINNKLLLDLMLKVGNYVGILEQNRVNSSDRPLHSSRIFAGSVVFVKRIIRRLMRWYMEPAWRQQTVFNSAVAPSIGCMNEINDELINNVRMLFREQRQLLNSQQTMNEQLQRLINENEQYARRQADLEVATTEQHIKCQADLKALSQTVNEQHVSLQVDLEAANTQHIKQQADLEATFQVVNEHHAKQQVALDTKLLAMNNELCQKQNSLEDIQMASNEQLVDVQTQMDKLKKLDLDVFAETYNNLWEKDVWHIGTFAQSGEDMVLVFLLRALEMPLNEVDYIDLGANHARTISNTYHFYRQGARGILVEANPALIPELKFYRNGDMILNRCVSEKSGEVVDFYVIGNTVGSGSGLSTSDKNSAIDFVDKNPALKIQEVINVETISVNDIIEIHMGKVPSILSIDIEGNEYEVLKSIDFTKIRPFIIIIEMIPYTNPYVVTGRDPEILKFLTDVDYLEYAFTGVNSIFLDKKQLEEKGRI